MTTSTSSFGSEWSAGRRLGDEAELDRWLALALELSDMADALALDAFRRDMVISTKPDRTFVTETDRAIEERIRGRILDAYPDHGIVGEEYGTEAADAGVRWYVDPIDGTHNFMRGVPLFGTLIGVERDGELQVGTVSAPAIDSSAAAAASVGTPVRFRRLVYPAESTAPSTATPRDPPT